MTRRCAVHTVGDETVGGTHVMSCVRFERTLCLLLELHALLEQGRLHDSTSSKCGLGPCGWWASRDWSYMSCWSKRVCMIPHQVDAVSDRVVLAVNGLMRARTVWRVGEQCTSECPSSENVNKFRRALTVWLVGFPRRRSSSSMHGRSSCISDLHPHRGCF